MWLRAFFYFASSSQCFLPAIAFFVLLGESVPVTCHDHGAGIPTRQVALALGPHAIET
jgi:hypothetical protein